MKTTRKELEIDFIGGQEPLTEKEEKALSEYFRNKKVGKTGLNKNKEVPAEKVN